MASQGARRDFQQHRLIDGNLRVAAGENVKLAAGSLIGGDTIDEPEVAPRIPIILNATELREESAILESARVKCTTVQSLDQSHPAHHRRA